MACRCPGDMRDRVTIQSVAEVADANGGLVETWSDVATVWAAVETTNAREAWRLQQLGMRADHMITIRYRDDVTNRNRVILDGRPMLVRGVRDPDRRKAWLVINAEEMTE